MIIFTRKTSIQDIMDLKIVIQTLEEVLQLHAPVVEKESGKFELRASIHGIIMALPKNKWYRKPTALGTLRLELEHLRDNYHSADWKDNWSAYNGYMVALTRMVDSLSVQHTT